MSKQPLVSVIVPTRNSAATLDACLKSIVKQTYKTLEVIVVDNNSTDQTKEIAKKYTKLVFNKGPERSAQRNYAVTKSKGEYVLIIDSDMELTPLVISACTKQIKREPNIEAIIIPEESFGIGFWAQCKKLERSFYIGNDAIEAARFFLSSLYRKLDGYDENMVSGEDWDLSHRAGQVTTIGRINELILHNEGRLKLGRTLKKKYYYAGLARSYLEKNKVNSKLTDETGPLRRYKLLLSRPGKLFRNPVYGCGVLFMKTCEFGFGGVGYYFANKGKYKAEKV
jgi:glycosyltransferase involved in cell wall biosynthesis